MGILDTNLIVEVHVCVTDMSNLHICISEKKNIYISYKNTFLNKYVNTVTCDNWNEIKCVPYLINNNEKPLKTFLQK